MDGDVDPPAAAADGDGHVDEFCTEIYHFKKNKIKLMLVSKYFPK